MRKILILITTLIATSYFSNSQNAHTINTAGNTFSPSSLTVTVGDTITWYNTGGNHNINATQATFPNNPEGFGNSIGTGWSFQWVFTVAGTYNYQCDPHAPGMSGVIIVYCASHPSPDMMAQAATIIEEVQLSGDNNSITNNTGGVNDFYEDYTASMYADITEGQSYTINITLGDLSGTNSYLGGAKVFIDYNINGDFNDAGENIGIIPVQASAGILVPLSFTVPTTGIYGPTRMRVVCQSTYDFNTPNDIGPCDASVAGTWGNPYFGATEDYTLVLSTTTTSCNITNSFSTINAACSSTVDGTINTNPSNGVLPYTYSWNNGSSTQNLTAVPSGFYMVTITDSLGCQLIDSVTLGFDNIKSISQTISTFIDTANPNYPAILNGYGNWAYDTLSIINNGCDVNIRPEFIISHSSQAIQQDQLELRYFHPLFGPMLIPYAIDNNGNAYGFWHALAGDSTGFDVTMFSTNEIVMRVKFLNSAPLGLYTAIWNTKEVDNLGNIIQTLTPNDTTLLTLVICNNFSASVSSSDITCFGDDDGSAVININNGSDNYTYSWSNGLTSDSISNLVPGNYFCNITDTNWGCTDSVNISITEPAELIVTSTTTNVSCNGGSDGTATLTLNGGTGNLTVNWFGMNPTALNEGTHIYTVTDSIGCTFTDDVIITDPITAITSSISITHVTSCLVANGSIDLTPIGGTPFSTGSTYTYAWIGPNGFNSTYQNISNLIAGSYAVTITDANWCTVTNSANVNQPASGLSLSLSSPNYNGYNISCYSGNNGEIITNVSGGLGAFSFVWDNGETTQNLSNLSEGSYSVTVTDSLGCLLTDSILLTGPTQLSSSFTSTDVSCFGLANGGAVVNFFGGATGVAMGDTNYILGWAGTPLPLYLPFPNTIFNTALLPPPYNAVPEGVYPYTVTDLNGCIIFDTITITQPDSLYIGYTLTNFNGSNISCYGGSDATVDVQINGGTSPFTHYFDGSIITNNLIQNLGADTYTDSIVDSNGCVFTKTITLTEPASLNGVLSAINMSCNGVCDGTINTQINGGTIPYSYLWNNLQTTDDLDSLCAGNYTVAILDLNGCTTNVASAVTEPAVITYTVDSLINTSSYGGNDGLIHISLSLGSGIISTSWSGPNSFTSSNEDIVNLEAGFYYLELQDSNLCMQLDTIEITQPSSLWMMLENIGEISCFDSCNGSINIIVNGGDSLYAFSWTGPNGFTSADEDITSLCEGEYILMMNDSSTMLIDTFNIYQPQPLSSILTAGTITCYEGQVTAEILVYGGSSPFQYNWSNGASDYSTNLSADIYTVEVTDSNGCILLDTITLMNPDSISLQVIATDVSCNGFQDAEATLSITNGGTTPFQYSVDNGINYQTVNTFYNLAAGTTYYLVIDANGCSNTITSTISEPDELVSTIITTNASCYGECDGTASIDNINGGTSPYSFDWGGANPNNLCANFYNLIVTDSNGCLTTNYAIITEPNPIIVNIWQNGNTLEATAGFFSYQWYDGVGNAINGATNDTFTPTIQGEYSVEVTGINGCSIISYGILVIINYINQNEIKLNIYPNPTKGLLIIETEKTIKTISIINTLGNELIFIDNNIASQKQTSIDLSSFAKGIYFLQLEINNQLIKHRIILQ